MYLSNPKRIQKVLFYLTRHPWHIPFYWMYSVRESSPLDVGLPWWSLPAIHFVDRKISRSSHVFEYGSGGSTLFLGQRFSRLTSIEQDSEWALKVSQKLSDHKLNEVEILQPEINLTSREDFDRSEYLLSLNKNHDLIVVDGEDHFGPDSTWSARTSCFLRAENFINQGGVILVDDSWRYPEIRKLSQAKEVKILEGIGPCRKGVTSTDLHFY
jgi:hypothetical protein